jgi:addiction module HigA family antidote
MLMSRADLDAGRVDLTDAESAERLPPVHPGDVLRHDFLEPLGLSAHALALALRVPPNRITAILAGERAVTAATALRLALYFGITPASGSTCKCPTNSMSPNAPKALASAPRLHRAPRPSSKFFRLERRRVGKAGHLPADQKDLIAQAHTTVSFEVS